MSKCVGMTDEILSPIIQTCNKLETLNLAGCPDLTDVSLDLIATELRKTLKILDLSGCIGLTAQVWTVSVNPARYLLFS